MIKSDSGLPGYLESLYLSESLTARLSEITILINPERLKYQASKTVIINSRDYQLTDVGLGNTLISRIQGIPGTTYVPYLPMCIPGIMWNGRYTTEISEFIEDAVYDPLERKLYISKIRGYQSPSDTDLDYIGYLQYQIGYNFYDSPFRDLDILKCREGLLFGN